MRLRFFPIAFVLPSLRARDNHRAAIPRNLILSDRCIKRDQDMRRKLRKVAWFMLLLLRPVRQGEARELDVTRKFMGIRAQVCAPGSIHAKVTLRYH